MDDIEKMQYKNLRTGFHILVKSILGEGYYNMSSDVYGCDLQCCSDIIDAYNSKVFKQVKNPFTSDMCDLITKNSINSIKLESVKNNN
jgi:hypothetical protein